MSMGMTYDEFWYGEPDRVKYYRQAEEIRRKEKDYDLWLQGRYIYDALCAVSPLLHAFAKNGTQAEKYNEDPYPRTMKDYKELQEKEAGYREVAFKYTKKKYGEGRRIFLMSALHHHYQKSGLFETKIVMRFFIISLLLCAFTLVTLKMR